MMNLRLANWQMWSYLGRRAAVWILMVEVTMAIWVAAAVGTASSPGRRDWEIFAALALATTLHMILTKPTVERRRAAHFRSEYIDHTGIWTVCGALVLPAHLLVVLILAIRVQRQAIARWPPARMIFSTAAILGSALTTNTIASYSVQPWITDQEPLPASVSGTLLMIGWVLLAMLAYYLVQTVLVGVARGLRTGWAWQSTIGSRKANLDFGATVAIGVIAACLTGIAPGVTLLLVTAVAVVWTRSAQRIDRLEDERRRLEVDALHDPLTGLLNRRGFDARAENALATCRARREHVAAMMFDMDHFKDTNTRLGHLGADQVLVAVAATIRDQLRDNDLLCRWGGEEIAVLCPAVEPGQANAIADRIRMAVAEIAVPVTDLVHGQNRLETGFTISGGVAVSTADGQDLAALQAAADDALQFAKGAGRNRVCVRSPAR